MDGKAEGPTPAQGPAIGAAFKVATLHHLQAQSSRSFISCSLTRGEQRPRAECDERFLKNTFTAATLFNPRSGRGASRLGHKAACAHD